jgi:enoyl-CoA hydratase/carnithine racemase
MGILKSRLPSATLHEALISGRRYDAAAALSGGIVDAVYSESDVLPEAVEMASALKGKDRATLVALKRGLYGKVIEQLTNDPGSAPPER